MATWLFKTEPSTYSIDDLARDGVTHWHGVRNYQARNFMMSMEPGDQGLFYHSSAEPPAIVGLVEIIHKAKPDPSQFEPSSDYYDPKATKEKPRWFCPDIKFVAKFKEPLGLSDLRDVAALADMELLKRGSRLSVQPVSPKEFSTIMKLAR